MSYKKLFAFTLAEILLTMTIVGAIATMTIPTLVNKRIQTERSAKLKKFYSRMSNAVDQMVFDGKSFKYMDKKNNSTEYVNWYKKDLDRYMEHKLIDGETIYFVDESSMKFEGTASDGNCAIVIYDTNGLKMPNKLGYDQYQFLFCFTDGSRSGMLCSADTFFGAQDPDCNGTADYLGECNDNQAYCTRYLQTNNWDYQPEYPFK